MSAFGAYTHKQAVRQETLAIDTATVAPDTTRQSTDTVAAPTPTPEGVKTWDEPTQTEPKTYFALQICASRTLLDASDPKLKGVPCEYRKVGDWYKYYAIIDIDRDKVVEKKKEIEKLFPDCWITKFEN